MKVFLGIGSRKNCKGNLIFEDQFVLERCVTIRLTLKLLNKNKEEKGRDRNRGGLGGTCLMSINKGLKRDRVDRLGSAKRDSLC
jgi:hypothetical protein